MNATNQAATAVTALRRAIVQVAIVADPGRAVTAHRRPVRGYATEQAPGLVIHQYEGAWQLTQASSGARVSRGFPTRRGAVDEAVRLARLADWTQPIAAVRRRIRGCGTCDGRGAAWSSGCPDCGGCGWVRADLAEPGPAEVTP